MDSDAALASQEEITKVVRAIVSESDLDKITPKDVRLAVLKQLGSRLGDDAKRTKALVKRALDVVLEDDPAPVAESAKAEPSTKVEMIAKAAKAAPSAVVEAVVSEAKSESKESRDNALDEKRRVRRGLGSPSTPCETRAQTHCLQRR